MSRPGLALVLSAPSGAGKSTLIHRLLKEFDAFSFSISCTTRAPRLGEVDGVDYHFLTKEEFKKKRAENFFAEWAEVHGNFYGTPLKAVQELLSLGRDVIFDIDVQGAAQLKKNLAGAKFIFILPPSLKVLEERLKNRGTDSSETILKRIHNAKQEIREAHWYDALIINDNLEQAYSELKTYYLNCLLHPKFKADFLNALLSSD